MTINDLKNNWGYGLLLLQRVYRPILSKHGVTPAEKRILYGLLQHHQLSKHALAKAVVLEPSAITRAMQRLEQSGHIQRHIDPNDKRAITLALTTKGKKTIQSIQNDALAIFSTACQHISEKDITQLTQTLEILNDNLTHLLENNP